MNIEKLKVNNFWFIGKKYQIWVDLTRKDDKNLNILCLENKNNEKIEIDLNDFEEMLHKFFIDNFRVELK